jgi:hypothetical protein
MITHLQGLDFRVHSPSCFELLSVRRDVDPTARVVIAYNGFKWWLHYERARVPVASRMFPSRDAAIALIAERAS